MGEQIGDLLSHVPALRRAYGKWPSLAYLIFATVLTRRRALLGGSAVGAVIYWLVTVITR